jgi:hypothetical protein
MTLVIDPVATTVAAILLIAVPIAFNAAFAALAATFDYPDILRRPTAARTWCCCGGPSP